MTDGGGASFTTDPASGTSAATDVSLREFVAQQIGSLDRHLTSELAALRRETEAANRNSDRAITVAAHEAADRLAAHNGLIDQMQAQGGTFATRETVENMKDETNRRIGRIEGFQAKIVGGLLVVTAVGIANLVKLWTG